MKLTSPAKPVCRLLPLAFLFALFFLFCSPSIVFAEEQHSLIDGHSHDEIKRGERFFKGLLPFNFKGQSCVSCHNLVPTDSLNWNPSAIAIAQKYADRDFESFQASIKQPVGNKLTEVHSEIELEEADLKTVKAYLDNLAAVGPQPVKPTINKILIFLFFGLLITWALLELIFFRQIKYRFVPVLVLLASLGYQGKVLQEEATKLGRSQDYAPDQPIKFSHKVHAGDNQIDCMYCHHTAEDSKSAGIPAMNLCMNCHVIVREGTHSGKFEIAKIVDAVENNKPVEWVRLHNLPDHVYFSHAQHVGVAEIDCQKCHGQVEEMDIMRQDSDLSMGWCVSCHRETDVKFKENGYYETFMKLHEEMEIGDLKSVKAEDIGANDCMRCHY
ncbi:cytochrome c3 family protein [Mangrovibacterium sp.]|uniref:cytochrome c3 family protein n=1 Tax=Mangrovibacterium sp. TaxID=1961364 RepID=UPI003561A796